MAADPAGNIYIPNNSGGITKITPGGRQSVIATELSPNGMAVDGAGNVYATSGVTLVKITPSGMQTMENVGNEQLNALEGGFSMPPNFEQVAGSGTPPDCTSTFSLAPGTSCNLSISFDPTRTGLIQSTAEGKDNSLNRNPATQLITLTGTGQ